MGGVEGGVLGGGCLGFFWVVRDVFTSKFSMGAHYVPQDVPNSNLVCPICYV